MGRRGGPAALAARIANDSEADAAAADAAENNADADTFAFSGFKRGNPDGLCFGKVPIGTPAFEIQGAMDIVNSREPLFNAIDNIRSTRTSFHLLRFCCSRNHNYWLRSMPPEHVVASARAHDERVWKSMEVVLNRKSMRPTNRAIERARMQSSLPTSNGGLGLGNAQLDSRPAYIGSWHLVADTLHAHFRHVTDALSRAFPARDPDQPDHPPSPPADLPDCLKSVHAATAYLNSSRPDDSQLPVISIDPSNRRSRTRHVQKQASTRVYQELRSRLVEQGTPNERIHLSSCSVKGAGSHLHAFPTGHFRFSYFDISDGAFLSSIQERLGLNVLGANPSMTCALCLNRFEHGFAHSHVCKHLYRGEHCTGIGMGAGIRHRRLQSEFCRLLNACGLGFDADTGANPRVVLPSGNEVDVIIHGLGDGDRPLALDFRVCYPLQSNTDRGTFLSQEEEKNEKYKAECDENDMDFSPFVLNTYGGLGPAALSVFNKLRRHAESQYDSDHWRHSWSAADFTNHWLQRFALVIARANHEMHRAVIPTTPNLAPSDFALP